MSTLSLVLHLENIVFRKSSLELLVCQFQNFDKILGFCSVVKLDWNEDVLISNPLPFFSNAYLKGINTFWKKLLAVTIDNFTWLLESSIYNLCANRAVWTKERNFSFLNQKDMFRFRTLFNYYLARKILL